MTTAFYRNWSSIFPIVWTIWFQTRAGMYTRTGKLRVAKMVEIMGEEEEVMRFSE